MFPKQFESEAGAKASYIGDWSDPEQGIVNTIAFVLLTYRYQEFEKEGISTCRVKTFSLCGQSFIGMICFFGKMKTEQHVMTFKQQTVQGNMLLEGMHRKEYYVCVI